MTEERGATLAALRGRRVSIGPVGSGSHALLLQLLKRNEVDQDVGELLALPPQEAADNLLAGEIDAAATLASWDAPVVQQLIDHVLPQNSTQHQSRRRAGERHGRATTSAVDRCRMLGDQIESEFHSKNAKQFISLSRCFRARTELRRSRTIGRFEAKVNDCVRTNCDVEAATLDAFLSRCDQRLALQ